MTRKPLVILDCAHNEFAIEALLESITVELGPEVKPRLIFGCLEDKQWERMAAMIGPRVRDVTITRAARRSGRLESGQIATGIRQLRALTRHR